MFVNFNHDLGSSCHRSHRATAATAGVPALRNFARFSVADWPARRQRIDSALVGSREPWVNHRPADAMTS